jgi:hypothetical protein
MMAETSETMSKVELGLFCSPGRNPLNTKLNLELKTLDPYPFFFPLIACRHQKLWSPRNFGIEAWL